MRTLVLQLARFGDVYQTWPTLNALARGGGEVHVLVRERFRGALDGLGGVVVHTLKTGDVLAPILADGDEAASLARLTDALDQLAALGFTRVINLSFSPLSSFVTDYLGQAGVEVRGYTRHADGFFTVADDFSAYFYAQVGVGRANRYHLIDLFAGVAGVVLSDADHRAATPTRPRAGVVVHLGASQPEKAYPPELWAEVLKALVPADVTLIGSPDERALAEAVCAAAGTPVTNLAGRTSVADLFDVLAGARLLIGADSAPVHIAALTDTPVLNLSCDAVNFWETGPVTAGSRVLFEPEIAQIRPARVAAEAHALLDGRGPTGPCYVRHTRGGPYVAHLIEDDTFAWALTEALYAGTEYPNNPTATDLLAFRRLHEIADLALAQLARWDGPDRAQAARQMSLVDQVLGEVPRLNPRVAPLARWFETERLRLGPAPEAETLARTRQLFCDLRVICSLYVANDALADVVRRAVELGGRVAPALREFDFARVEGEFQSLISTLQDLAGRSTKVGGWSKRIAALGECLVARDFIELADRLEYDLPRDLKTLVPDVLV